ncbi:terpene synthase family protein [Streptomyces qinglanensis]|uniref:terpene synthase family protein n=1 Tax=Streptomyces qinglanensis TaxID=943816 RepID=UPI003D749C24
MPRNVTFTIPFPPRYNPHYSHAQRKNLDWLRRHGMVSGQQAVDLYLSWDLADLAARCWPEADAADLSLTVDLKSFYFLFDDQFDGPQGSDPPAVAEVCHELIGIAHQDADTTPRSAAARAFADLWARCRSGMSSAWIARAACDWERYFASYPYESWHRSTRQVPAMDDCLEIRRGSAATESVVGMVERLNRIEVPRTAFHSPQLRLMRRTAVDVPFIANDVYSYEKETARGDVYDILVSLQDAHACTLDEAVRRARAMVDRSVDRFLRVRSELPRLCGALGLDDAERDAVLRYAKGLEDWLRGHNDWMMRTARYAPGGTPGPDRPGYAESLLGTG